MIYSTGIDIVQCARIQNLFQHHRERFLNRILTEKESSLIHSHPYPVSFLAGRWAAKEAFSKALGTGIRKDCSWQDIEIFPDEKGKPFLVLSGNAKKMADFLKISHIHLSISHERDYAVASVLLETDL